MSGHSDRYGSHSAPGTIGLGRTASTIAGIICAVFTVLILIWILFNAHPTAGEVTVELPSVNMSQSVTDFFTSGKEDIFKNALSDEKTKSSGKTASTSAEKPAYEPERDINPYAVLSDRTKIHWSSIIICCAAVSGFALASALYVSRNARRSTIWFVFVITAFLTIVFGRMLFYAFFPNTYPNLTSALFNPSRGSWCIIAILPALLIASMLAEALGFDTSSGRILDCMAPGAALFLALLQTAAMYNNTLRGNVPTGIEVLKRLPFSDTVSRGGEYFYTAFFPRFLLLMLATFFLLWFFFNRRKKRMKGDTTRNGHVSCMFIALYAATELLTDSVRTDRYLINPNGFLSLSQLVSIVAMAGVLLYYTILSARQNGKCGYHNVLWIAFVLCAAAIFICDALLSGEAEKVMFLYAVKAAALFIMLLVIYLCYTTCCGVIAANAKGGSHFG